MFCVLFLSVLPLVALHADDAKPTALLVTGVYADPSIVAPVAWYRHDDQNGRAYRVGVSGWTLEGEWTARRSPAYSLLFAADATPMNAHNSDRTYDEGERTKELDYENASYRIRGGLRLHAGESTDFEVLLVGLYESVDGLPAHVMERWENPYAGIEVAYTYRNVRDEQPLIASIDGLELTMRGEGFVGETSWTRINVSQQWGNSVGRFHLRQGSFAVLGTHDDFVNRSLIGGSWDALGGRAVHGLRHGEIRTSHALGGHFGADVQVARTWYVGARASVAVAEDIIQGYALNVSGTWRTFGFSGGVAIAESTGYRKAVPELYGALIIPLHRR